MFFFYWKTLDQLKLILIKKEKNFVLNGLKEKAKLVFNLFNSMKGIQCNELQGAMYAFPKIDIPRRAIEYARVNEVFEYNSSHCYSK